VLDATQLPDAIRRHAAAISTGPVKVSVDAPADLPALPEAVETAAYRIAQEALTNVVRHADARHAHITLNTAADALTVTVTDDGHGINRAPSAASAWRRCVTAPRRSTARYG
jgi:signal transduction histidine kinase